MVSRLLLLAALLGAPAASDPGAAGDPSAEPLPLRVDWTAEPSCPDAEALRVELVRLLHRELRFDPDAEARVEGIIRRRGGGFELELSVSAGELHERRTLTADRCEELRTAAALVVAVALEPWAAGEAPRSVPEPEDAPEVVPPEAPGEHEQDAASTETGADPPTAPVPRAPEEDYDDSLDLEPPAAAPSPSPSARRSVRVGLLVHGGLGVAQPVRLAGGLGGAIAVLGRAWRVELTGIHWWPTQVDVAQGASVRARLAAGGVRGCWVPGRGRWELPACAGLEAGAIRARATGPGVTTITSTGPWLGIVAGAGAAWRATGWLAVRASADLTIAAWRPTFHLEQGSSVVTVLTPPPVGARLLAGVELRLPVQGE
jgi:hypothetical protein